MTKNEAREFARRMALLDTSEIERRLSTPERRVQQLDQIWLVAQTAGLLGPRPLDLSRHNVWAGLHRAQLGDAG